VSLQAKGDQAPDDGHVRKSARFVAETRHHRHGPVTSVRHTLHRRQHYVAVTEKRKVTLVRDVSREQRVNTDPHASSA
jgi:hypothetical protein